MEPRLRFDIRWPGLAWALLGAPVSPEDARARLDAACAARWPGRAAVPALSVRSLFDALLRARAGAFGGGVVMTAVNVDGMAAIARAHGLAVHVVDIDPDTLAPEPGALAAACRRTGARLVVAAQLFGAVSPVFDDPELARLGVLRVEDAAQAFAGRFYDGDPNADVSLFSFGPIKRATALGGAVGVFADPALSDPALSDDVRGVVEGDPALSDAWFRRRAAKYAAFKALSVPAVYGGVIAALRLAGRDPETAIGAAARSFSSSAALVEAIRRRPPARMQALLARRLEEPHDAVRRAEAMAWLIARLPARFCAVGAAARAHAWWLAPLLGGEPDRASSDLRRRGFDATRGATSMRVLDAAAAPRAAAMMRDLFYVPHPVALDARRRQRLVDALAASAA